MVPGAITANATSPPASAQSNHGIELAPCALCSSIRRSIAGHKSRVRFCILSNAAAMRFPQHLLYPIAS